MDKSDQEYVQEKIDKFLDDECLIHNIKRYLRVHIIKSLKKTNNRKLNLLENERIAIILRLIHEFLNYYEINNTCAMLEEEFNEIFQMNINESSGESNELGILNDSLECNTKIESLLKYKLSSEKCEIDEVTNIALIEASNCIESLQNEIKTLHNIYFEQVNAAREIMERKVSDIEKLYLESISKK
ncbi:uncharacterized protein cubi_02986 [Cryptosporidium ubiquitum]|uniref:LisH domain-containing protein n=1 Tax=Cryptosporidium ubiquitum TaxID=857276 RepID=A0A1J4MKZ1_9CRYT|nr:uncharacterized protein cubi_02986 [Cryptosporidium ubiquitum]OII74854.1 hypothetical protein cubi_02986 [Cryptosporidium ubiquitum]